MNQLVFIENGKTVTDSLMVAEVFGKEHKHVLRDIEQLECSREFSQSNFGLSTYTNDRGRVYPKYIITQDGFSFLAMGYTGKEAARFKEMYIKAFNQMHEQLQGKGNSPIKALMQATHNLLASQELIVERLDDVEQKIDNQITLDSGEQRILQKAVRKRVCEFEPDKDARKPLFSQLHNDIYDRWGVPSYRDVLRKDIQNVLRYVSAWVPKREVN